jgi:VanZ family protein
VPRSRLVSLWLPVAAWAATIFVLSSFSTLESGLGTWDVVLRKGAHVVEFFVLGALLVRALGQRSVAAFLAGLAYAASDELHQHFVPGRHGSPLDIAIDAVGVAAGVAVVRRVGR